MIVILSMMAAWRLTYMLVEEVGPYSIFEKFRSIFIVIGKRLVLNGQKSYEVPDRIGKNVVGEILICIYCCSVWVSIPFGIYLAYLEKDWLAFPIYWLSISAGTIFVEKIHRLLTEYGS